MFNFDETISEFILEEKRRQRKWELRQLEKSEEWWKVDAWKQNFLDPKVRPASANDYFEWLVGYVKNGGVPTHYYDRPMNSNFYVAKDSIKIRPLFGSAQVNIIVPEGLEVTGSYGHSSIYCLDGFTTPTHWVPIYSNTKRMRS